MQPIEVFNLISAIASIILSVLAIWLSLYFYDKSKGSENKVQIALESIKTQTESLEKLSSRWMDRLTRYVTGAKPADETNILLMEVVKTISTKNVASQIGDPSTENATKTALQAELITSYIVLHYYCATTNVTSQPYLPAIEELDDTNSAKNLVDSSYADFYKLDSIILNLDQSKLDENPSHDLYLTTVQLWKPLVKNTVQILTQRAQPQASQ